MDEKISLEAIAAYGDAYAEKVMKNFFSSRQRITGAEILSLCNIQQINLFVVSELFKAWKEETRKQKSAYFDYENPEVKEAMASYMSVLSNYISVDRPSFSPLLKKAVMHTLLAVFDPYDFFSMLISGKDDRLEVNAFREEIKYLRVNKGPLERMLQKLEAKKITEVQGNEAFAVLDEILEEVNFTPEDLDGYIEKFSAVVPLDPSSFYITKPQEPARPVRENRFSAPEPARNNVAQEQNNVVRESRVIIEEKKTIVHENKIAEPTINDRMNKAKQPAVIDSFRKIAKIKDNLSINQKFMFTKVLFYGDFESFSRAVDDLDQLSDINAALQYLESHSSSWDRESKEFHEFMEMVEKRFS
jgi:hypothetical protein